MPSPISDALSTLSDRGLRRLLGARTFLRGLDYARRRVVEDVQPLQGEALSERELAVLRLLGQGTSNREIAQRLSLTEGTVKNYISSILSKTGLHDRTQAALYAVRHNLTG